jgi:hypothetical protein
VHLVGFGTYNERIIEYFLKFSLKIQLKKEKFMCTFGIVAKLSMSRFY